MIICALVIVFFVTVLSGPAGVDYINKRKQLRERPLAKVLAFPYPKEHPRNVR